MSALKDVDQLTEAEARAEHARLASEIAGHDKAYYQSDAPKISDAAYDALRRKLEENTRLFREEMTKAGFTIKPGTHPIVPVMLFDAVLAQEFARRLLDEGIYAVGFFFPVVAKGQARIRTQMSAAHSREHLERAVAAFTKVGRELGVI